MVTHNDHRVSLLSSDDSSSRALGHSQPAAFPQLSTSFSSSLGSRTALQSGRSYAFDRAFGPYSTQQDVYETARPLVESVIRGYVVFSQEILNLIAWAAWTHLPVSHPVLQVQCHNSGLWCHRLWQDVHDDGDPEAPRRHPEGRGRHLQHDPERWVLVFVLTFLPRQLDSGGLK